MGEIDSYVGKRSTLNIDALLLKTSLGNKFPHEYQSKIDVPENLIERKMHTSDVFKEVHGYSGQDTVTVLIPPWGFDKKLHDLAINYAKHDGPVLEFNWNKEAISSDVETTATCYRKMMDYVSESLKTVMNMKEKYEIKNIKIVSCSAGVPIATGALNNLLEEKRSDIFDSISDVTLVGMADNFADCYRYGARTKDMGEIAENVNGYNISDLKKAFDHMAPINALPALNQIKGNVTWITSYDDTHFPLENQKRVVDEINATNSKVKVLNIPKIGHVGISALYYVAGAGLTENKTVNNFISSSIYKKTTNVLAKMTDKILGFMEKCSTGGITDFDVPDSWIDESMGYSN